MDVTALIALLLTTHLAAAAAAAASPRVIVVGGGFSGISAAKTLSDAGIDDFLILEATGRIGGRIHKTEFAGVSVELGANWVEGVGGSQMNPIWDLANKLRLRNFLSDYTNLSSNTYKQEGGLFEKSVVQEAIDASDKIELKGEKLSGTLPASGRGDISVLTLQRLQNHVPSTPVDMVVDFYVHDYGFAEPPRVTSLQNTLPLPTFANFGDDVHFVADRRGYESVVHHVAHEFLKTDKNGTIVDRRLLLNKKLLWRQKAKMAWVKGGSKFNFFHKVTVCQWQENRITQIVNLNRVEVKSEDGIKIVFTNYFSER